MNERLNSTLIIKANYNYSGAILLIEFVRLWAGPQFGHEYKVELNQPTQRKIGGMLKPLITPLVSTL